MKIKVLDLCMCDENNICNYSERDLFDPDLFGDWKGFIAQFNAGNLDDFHINIDEVDKSVYIFDDGGTIFRLKDGSYVNVCWRGDMCRAWLEDDYNRIEYFDQKLGVEI